VSFQRHPFTISADRSALSISISSLARPVKLTIVLALGHGRVGIVEARQGTRDSALKALRDGREIIARLKAQAPHNATLFEDLVRFDDLIATLER
jgi:hypothetical protein